MEAVSGLVRALGGDPESTPPEPQTQGANQQDATVQG